MHQWESVSNTQVEKQASESRDIEERPQASAFTVAAVMAVAFIVHRERSFQQNERWFEDTMPHLGEEHFKQAFCVSLKTMIPDRLCELIEGGFLESPAATKKDHFVKPVILCDQVFPVT